MVNALSTALLSTQSQMTKVGESSKNEKNNKTDVSTTEDSKVETIKKRINSGEYQLDMQQTAKALVES